MDVADIIARLNTMGFEDTADDDKMDVINDTLWDIESRQLWPWSIKSINLTVNGVSATPTNMPSDFKSVKWVTDTTTGNTLWWERLDTIRNRYGSQLSLVQDPWCFFFQGDTFKFYPIPATASTTRYVLDYYAQQPELTTTSVEANIYMPPRHHRAILLGAASKIYQIEDDQELATSNKQDYEQRLQTMAADYIKKQYVNPDQIFVIDEDDEWTY
jgi:hypothetical protein